jgi:hypothetical protein
MHIALISKGRVPSVNPISPGCAKKPSGGLGTARSATEICGRDFLSLVPGASNSKLLGNEP